MKILHNSNDLDIVRDTIPTCVYNFLEQQFAFLEDPDPQMDVYGNPDFICTTGTVGIISSSDEILDMEILEETELEDITVFTCMDGTMLLDIVLYWS